VARPTDPCGAIAGDIERIARQYPQLLAFRATDAQRSPRTGLDCRIDYELHTHRPAQTGGWSAGVPHPDPDGIWFYIGLWDPHSDEAMSQINTQPVMAEHWIGDRRVTFLILEGTQTRPVARELDAILRRNGMR
jgi:hypothetical protein